MQVKMIIVWIECQSNSGDDDDDGEGCREGWTGEDCDECAAGFGGDDCTPDSSGEAAEAPSPAPKKCQVEAHDLLGLSPAAAAAHSSCR